MRAHRLVKARHAAAALEGEGARRVGGRWNPPGLPMVYCASSLSLAVLELLVHVDPADLPADLIAIELEFPEDPPLRRLLPGDLPLPWREEAGRSALQALGREWLQTGAEGGLVVPSVIVPAETHLLINPGHPGCPRIRVLGREPFSLDPRLA